MRGDDVVDLRLVGVPGGKTSACAETTTLALREGQQEAENLRVRGDDLFPAPQVDPTQGKPPRARRRHLLTRGFVGVLEQPA